MQLAGLRLDQRDVAMAGGDSGEAIKPGNSQDSLLIQRLVDKDLGILMPPAFPFPPGAKVGGLPEKQTSVLKAWIDQGARWPDGVSLAAESESAADDSQQNALFAAIRAGDAKAAPGMINDQRLLNCTDKHGSTPLMHAALYADGDMVRLLLDRGADVNIANKDGATALMWAAGNLNKVRWLLKKGATVDIRTGSGRTPLLIAATYAGNAEVVRLLLKNGAKTTDQDNSRETALTSASKRGDVQLVEALIEAGADVHAGGRSPLAWAAEEGSVETIACLLKHGASEQRDSLNEALFNAAVRGPTEAVRLLLDHGADPSTPSGFAGYTPLMGAAYSESPSTGSVRLLLEKASDAKAKAANGETALSLARKRGHTEIVELLEKAGAVE